MERGYIKKYIIINNTNMYKMYKNLIRMRGLYNSTVKSIVIYGLETWIPNEAKRKRIGAREIDVLTISTRNPQLVRA